MDLPSTPFNVVLAEARADHGYSISKVATETGFTPSFIRSYEEVARNPTAQTMWRFAKAYGLKFEITHRGVTITDRHGTVVLEHWADWQ